MGVPFLLALALAFVLIGGASILFERLLYARLYRASELDQVLLSIGLVFMATAAFTFAYGPSPQRVDVPGYLSGQIDLGLRAFPTYRVFLIAVGLGLMAALWLLFERTLIGARIRAAVDNRRMAQSVGIDVEPTVHLDLRLRQRSRRARRRSRGRHRRAVADLRDPIPRVLPDRGHGRRRREPVGRVHRGA